jgi:hypothetical protein
VHEDTTVLVDGYQYTFDPSVSMSQVNNALILSGLAAEAIHGRAQVQLNAHFRTDPATYCATIAAATEVGQTIARVFTELVSREFGEEAFSVARTSVPVMHGHTPLLNESGTDV